MTDLGDIDTNKKPSDLYEAGLIVGKLKSQLKQIEKCVLILQVRSRIEELENKFLKSYMLTSLTRYGKWDLILRGPLRQLRKKNELRRFRSTVTSDNEEFIQTITDLYGEFSDVAAHNVHYSLAYDETSVTDMLVKCNITPDRAKIDAVMTILRPIP